MTRLAVGGLLLLLVLVLAAAVLAGALWLDAAVRRAGQRRVDSF